MSQSTNGHHPDGLDGTIQEFQAPLSSEEAEDVPAPDVDPDQDSGEVTRTEDQPADEGVTWEIRDLDPANPFHASLVLSDPEGPICEVDLDPIRTRNLRDALDGVLAAQFSVLTGTPVDPTAFTSNLPDLPDTDTGGDHDTPSDRRAARKARRNDPERNQRLGRRILLGLVILVGIAMSISALLGGVKI